MAQLNNDPSGVQKTRTHILQVCQKRNRVSVADCNSGKPEFFFTISQFTKYKNRQGAVRKYSRSFQERVEVRKKTGPLCYLDDVLRHISHQIIKVNLMTKFRVLLLCPKEITVLWRTFI
jgi:hypothetical protein